MEQGQLTDSITKLGNLAHHVRLMAAQEIGNPLLGGAASEFTLLMIARTLRYMALAQENLEKLQEDLYDRYFDPKEEHES